MTKQTYNNRGGFRCVPHVPQNKGPNKKGYLVTRNYIDVLRAPHFILNRAQLRLNPAMYNKENEKNTKSITLIKFT